jgi:hypothetical protein
MIAIAARAYVAFQPFSVSGEDVYGTEARKGGDIAGGKKGKRGRKYELYSERKSSDYGSVSRTNIDW